jgi:hypothetical protein
VLVTAATLSRRRHRPIRISPAAAPDIFPEMLLASVGYRFSVTGDQMLVLASS